MVKLIDKQNGATPENKRDWSDQITLCEAGCKTSRPLGKIVEDEQAFVAKKVSLRRQNISESRDPMECAIADKTVENLYTLGEIGWKEAIKLDYFASLDAEDKDALLWFYEQEIDRYLSHYGDVNKVLSRKLADFEQANSLAIDALSNAHTLSMTSAEAQSMEKEELDDLLIQNYRQNNAEYHKNVTKMQDCLGTDTNLGLDMLEQLRKYSANRLVTYSRYADFCELLANGKMGRSYRDALNSVRYGSLPRSAIQRVHESKAVYVARLFGVVDDVLSDRKRSDLVIISENESPTMDKTA